MYQYLFLGQLIGKGVSDIFSAVVFWLLILSGILLTVIYYTRSTREIHRLPASMNDIDQMEPTEFEDLVKTLLRAEGYATEPQGTSTDGADLVITDWRGRRTAVQTRRGSGKEKLNKQSIRELLEVQNRHGYERVMIVTNTRLTHWADEYARANSVETWDREFLRKHLGKSERKTSQEARRSNLFWPTEYHKKRDR